MIAEKDDLSKGNHYYKTPIYIVVTLQVAYAELFDRSLADDVRDETSGDFKHLLMAMILAERDELFEVDEDQAQADATAIYEVQIKAHQRCL